MSDSSASIFEQVGGNDVVKTAVTVFYNRVSDDESLNPWFEGVDLSRLRAHQRAFLSAALDGPRLFAGRDLAQAHAGMAITDDAFDAIVHHLLTALGDLEIAPALVDQVADRLEALRDEVVSSR